MHRKPTIRHSGSWLGRRLGSWLGSWALIAAMPLLPWAAAQSAPSTHHLTLANVAQSVDSRGRLILVAVVRGDVAGVLTVAVSVAPNGTIQGGEWALDASRIELGPPGTDGDGDPVETLVRLGFLKGTVSGGGAVLNEKGMATDLSRVQLTLTGATATFAGAKTGSGSMGGTNLHLRKSSNGFLTLTF